MARTIAQIEQGMIDAKNADPVLSALDSTSAVATWLLWISKVALAIQLIESLFDNHKAEVAGIIAAGQPHTLLWYTGMAKAFQFGYALPSGSDVYATIDNTVQIVTQANTTEVPNGVRLKVAKGGAGTMVALSGTELTAFTAYMQRVKDAGVRLMCTSGPADDFRTAMQVWYDPLIIGADGARLDGTNATPVQAAITNFLAALPFNGLFEEDALIAAIKAVDGVKTTQVTYCGARYGSIPYATIGAYYVPDAGYMALDVAYFVTNSTYTAYGF